LNIPENRPTLSLKKKKPPSKEDSTPNTQKSTVQKLNSIKNLKKSIGETSTKFPNCFTTDRDKMKPLKIGILEDLVETFPHKTKTHIRRMLRLYTSNPHYLNALLSHSHRFNLHGNMSGEVSDAQKEIAKKLRSN
tara:strand:- start:3003 stop:3407 length:405 start_codon:yes stop_codon:yes gene_type:complete